MKKAAFIGVGNMGGALARAACRAVGADQVVLFNRTPDKAKALGAELGCEVVDSAADAAWAAEYLFLGAKPDGVPALLEELGPQLRDRHRVGEDKVAVSMAAGLTIKDLRPHLAGAGYYVPVVRVMPNTCVAIGKGMTALCAGEAVGEEYIRGVEEILAATGRMERIPEGMMDQFSAVAGCGPAFVYPYIEGLADGGVMAGLPRAKALEYAAQMVLGAAAMVLESGKHPGQLKDEVCSPGGSTIAGVAELERHGLRSAAMDAVMASWRRSMELGK